MAGFPGVNMRTGGHRNALREEKLAGDKLLQLDNASLST
jgi:hypothetical protein